MSGNAKPIDVSEPPVNRRKSLARHSRQPEAPVDRETLRLALFGGDDAEAVKDARHDAGIALALQAVRQVRNSRTPDQQRAAIVMCVEAADMLEGVEP